MDETSDLALVARDVGVRFDLDVSRRRTIRQALGELVHGRPKAEPFWALRDVTLTVETGEVLGVVGRNGSGKSTLLLVLAGILRPDTGLVRAFGRTSTLLTLGAGFQPELTGRENIFLSGAFLGQSRRTMNELVEPITDFSGLGDFIDVPIRKYSAGMRARLGFSIATHIEPDILLLDEVLGVGDEEFKEQSRRRIRELMERARSIVVVSHDLTFVEKTCTRCLWLRDGRVEAIGPPDEIVVAYRDSAQGGPTAVRPVSGSRPAGSPDGAETHEEGGAVVVEVAGALPPQRPGARVAVSCRVTNRGAALDTTSAEHPIRLSYRLFDGKTGAYRGHGPRTDLPPVLESGQTVGVDLLVAVPREPGVYHLRVALVEEFVRWLDDADHGASVTLVVEAAAATSARAGRTGATTEAERSS